MDRKRISCPLEEMFVADGYVVVYDGQQSPSGDGSRQFTSSPSEIRYFTRKLRKMVKGQFVDKWKVLTYDLRDGFVVDVKENPNESDKKRRRAIEFNEQRDEETLEAGGNMRCFLGWVHGIGNLWEKLLRCAT